MTDAGYRAAPPGTTCSRCGGFLDASRAMLSSEGLPVCARCDAQMQIAASAPKPGPALRIPWRLPWRIPWNDAFVSLGVGAALFVGAPVSAVGLWQEWLPFGAVFAFYGLGVPLVVATTVRALLRASRTPPAGAPVPSGQPAALPRQQTDAAVATVGAGMAATGCGVITLVVGVAVVLVLALLGYVVYTVLKAIGLA